VVADAEIKAYRYVFVLITLGQNKPYFSLPEGCLRADGCVLLFCSFSFYLF